MHFIQDSKFNEKKNFGSEALPTSIKCTFFIPSNLASLIKRKSIPLRAYVTLSKGRTAQFT